MVPTLHCASPMRDIPRSKVLLTAGLSRECLLNYHDCREYAAGIASLLVVTSESGAIRAAVIAASSCGDVAQLSTRDVSTLGNPPRREPHANFVDVAHVKLFDNEVLNDAEPQRLNGYTVGRRGLASVDRGFGGRVSRRFSQRRFTAPAYESTDAIAFDSAECEERRFDHVSERAPHPHAGSERVPLPDCDLKCAAPTSGLVTASSRVYVRSPRSR